MFMDALLLALGVASVSWTVTQEEIFSELREWCKGQQGSKWLVVLKATYLQTCYYCFSHWVTILTVALTRFTLFRGRTTKGRDTTKGRHLSNACKPCRTNHG